MAIICLIVASLIIGFLDHSRTAKEIRREYPKSQIRIERRAANFNKLKELQNKTY